MTKRFYEDAAATTLDDGAFSVALDGRPIRTPGGAVLSVPVESLAAAVAAEWAAQEDEVRPLTMPLMRLAATAVDRIGRERDAVVAQLATYGESDLLCYRADGPAALVDKQEEAWQPLLDWLAAVHGASLLVTHGVTHIAQPAEALAALRDAVSSLDDHRIAAVSQLITACGSLVLALAVTARRIDAGEAVAASQLDELWQAEEWGHEEEATKRRRALAEEIESAARFLDLLEG